MRKFAGLILDIYDDVGGDTFREIYPTEEEVPLRVKEARSLKRDERQQLPDTAFALVLMNGPETLRKFACVDEGNTDLSVQYFLQTGYRLPAEAQKVAAKSLVTACGWYDLAVPEEVTKVALGLTALTVALAGPGAVSEAGKNLKAVKGAGGSVVTPAQAKQRRMQMGLL